MNRNQKREAFQRLRKLSPEQFWSQMNVLHSRAYGLAQKHYEEAMDVVLHSRAYGLAQKHYEEAMDVVLQPKQKAAVVAKAHEIRELWDGLREITTSETEAEFFKSIEEGGG